MSRDSHPDVLVPMTGDDGTAFAALTAVCRWERQAGRRDRGDAIAGTVELAGPVDRGEGRHPPIQEIPPCTED